MRLRAAAAAAAAAAGRAARARRSPRCSSRSRRRRRGAAARAPRSGRRAGAGGRPRAVGRPATTSCTCSPRRSRAVRPCRSATARRGRRPRGGRGRVAAVGAARAAVHRRPGRRVSRRSAAGVGEEPIDSVDPGVQVTSAGVLTLEDGGSPFLRDRDGRTREVHAAARRGPGAGRHRGRVWACADARGVLIVFDLRSGHRDPPGRAGPLRARDHQRARRSRRRATSRRPSRSATAATCCCGRPPARRASACSRAGASSRVAIARRARGVRRRRRPARRRRAFVIDPRSRRIVVPRAAGVRRLVAAASTGATSRSRSPAAWSPARRVSRRTIPPGPCSRSDLAVDSVEIRDDRVGVRMACINSPNRSCRVTARVRTRSGARGGAGSPTGCRWARRGCARFGLNRHGRARGVRLQLTVRVAS